MRGMKPVKIVKESKKGLDWLGKIVTHKDLGEGIVVGYSNISGEPFVVFYDGDMGKKICSVSSKCLTLT